MQTFGICRYQTSCDSRKMKMQSDAFLAGLPALRYLDFQDVVIENQPFLSPESVSGMDFAVLALICAFMKYDWSADCRLFSPPQKRFDCTLNFAGTFILFMRGGVILPRRFAQINRSYNIHIFKLICRFFKTIGKFHHMITSNIGWFTTLKHMFTNEKCIRSQFVHLTNQEVVGYNNNEHNLLFLHYPI